MANLRYDIGSEYLRKGESFDVGDIRLVPMDDSLEVVGWSNYYSIESLNKAKAREELQDIKRIYKTLAKEWEDLQKFSQDKSVIFYLALSFGKGGGIPICIEENGKLRWETELQE
jgi:hypothetical protein